MPAKRGKSSVLRSSFYVLSEETFLLEMFSVVRRVGRTRKTRVKTNVGAWSTPWRMHPLSQSAWRSYEKQTSRVLHSTNLTQRRLAKPALLSASLKISKQKRTIDWTKLLQFFNLLKGSEVFRLNVLLVPVLFSYN